MFFNPGGQKYQRAPPKICVAETKNKALLQRSLHLAVKRPPSRTKRTGRKVKLPVRCSLNLSAHFAVWVKLWVTSPDPLFDPHYFRQKQKKISQNQAISGEFWSCNPDLNSIPQFSCGESWGNPSCFRLFSELFRVANGIPFHPVVSA